jgi:hypothetical protein
MMKKNTTRKIGEKYGGYRQSYVARATSPQAGDQKKAH